MKLSLLRQSPLVTLTLMLSASGIFGFLLADIAALTSSISQGLALAALGCAAAWLILLRGVASPTLVWTFTLISLVEWLWRGGGTGSWLLVFGAVGLISEARQVRNQSPRIITLQAGIGLSLGGLALALCGYPFKGALLASCGGIFAAWQRTGRSVRHLSSFFPLLVLFLIYYLPATRAIHQEFLYRYSGDQEIPLDSPFLFSRLGALAVLGCLSAISSHSRKLGMIGAISCGCLAAWDYSHAISGFGVLFPWEFSLTTSLPLAFSSGAVLPLGAALWGVFSPAQHSAYFPRHDDSIVRTGVVWGLIATLVITTAALVSSIRSAHYGSRFSAGTDQLRTPPHLLQNLLQAEDFIFFEHGGVDWARAKSVVIRACANGALGRGASTISMQLGKILYLSYRRTLWRKAEQMILGVALETQFSKDQILAWYLNTLDFGPGGIGITAASDFYFKKAPIKLTENESIMLVMTIPDPYTVNPNLIAKSKQLQRKMTLAKARSRVVERLFSSQIQKLSLVRGTDE